MTQVVIRPDAMDPASLSMVQQADGRRVPLLTLPGTFDCWTLVDPAYVERQLLSNNVYEPTDEELARFVAP